MSQVDQVSTSRKKGFRQTFSKASIFPLSFSYALSAHIPFCLVVYFLHFIDPFIFVFFCHQKRAFNKLKHDLEPWRNLIVHVDSVLVWEKNFFPAIIFAGVTTFFVALWAMDLSIITLLALSCLLGILFDFIYPTISRILFNADQWSGKQEAQFEHVVTQLCDIKFLMMGWYEYLFANKEKKSTMVSKK